jgi:hypothetical protein
MSETGRCGMERVFTLELNSRTDVRDLILPNQHIVMEGTIGALKHAEFVDAMILEFAGTRGILRIYLAREDLARCG